MTDSTESTFYSGKWDLLPSIRPTIAEINLDAIRFNVDQLFATITTPIWAVVKADAYGHGDTLIAKALDAHPPLAWFRSELS